MGEETETSEQGPEIRGASFRRRSVGDQEQFAVAGHITARTQIAQILTLDRMPKLSVLTPPLPERIRKSRLAHPPPPCCRSLPLHPMLADLLPFARLEAPAILILE